jgi:hypothetical protein
MKTLMMSKKIMVKTAVTAAAVMPRIVLTTMNPL